MASELTKPCPICCVEVKSCYKSPESCIGGHGEDQKACSECWEAYLSQEVEEKTPHDIRCMFCPENNGTLELKELKKFARKGTLERYQEKIQDATHYRCQNRCWASKRDPNERNSPSVLQPHNRKADGRVFTCKFCDYKTCIDCDRPEHHDETCEDYRARIVGNPDHTKAEAKTAKVFKRCPNCAGFWEWDPEKGQGCGYTRCEACKFRFCGNCMIPWVGEGSAYLLGKEGHKEGCRFGVKEVESKYALRKRHESDGQAKARIRGMKDKKRETGEKKRAKKAAGGEDEVEVEVEVQSEGELAKEPGMGKGGKKAVKKQGTKRKAEQMEGETDRSKGVPKAQRSNKSGSKA